MPWLSVVIVGVRGKRVRHVYPDFGREHVEDSECWCQPEIEEEDDGFLVIHNEEH